MAEENDRRGLLDGREANTRPYSPPNEYDGALFHEKGKSPKEGSPGHRYAYSFYFYLKIIMYLFISFVVVMVMITTIISLYRGSKVDGTYVLLGVSIISIGLVEVVLVLWSRSGELPAEKLWFLYFVGICIALESMLTDVLLFHRPENV